MTVGTSIVIHGWLPALALTYVLVYACVRGGFDLWKRWKRWKRWKEIRRCR